jgi:hypothetical protein
MTPARVFTALALTAAAAGLVAFGVIRGVSDSGPARGVRIAIAIDPPVDAEQLALAEAVVHDRLEEKGAETRVLRTGDGLIAEIGADDPDGELVRDEIALVERTAPLEVHAVDTHSVWLAQVAEVAATDPVARAAGIRVDKGTLLADDQEHPLSDGVDPADCFLPPKPGVDLCIVHGDRVIAKYVAAKEPPADRLVMAVRIGDLPTWRAYVLDKPVLLVGPDIRAAHVSEGGVDLELASPEIRVAAGTVIAFVLAGHLSDVALADRASTGLLHVRSIEASQDAAYAAADRLLAIAQVGAVHPLHVVRREAFARATGFVPRAWPFLAAAGVLLIVAGCVLLLRRRVH